jgi:hypothetical protein
VLQQTVTRIMGEDKFKKNCADTNMGTNIPKGGISCERGANNEEPVSVFDDTITFFVLKKEFTEKKKKENFLPCGVKA